MIHNHYGEQQGDSFKKLKIELPHNPEIPQLDIYPEKTIIQRDACTPMFHSVSSVQSLSHVRLFATP